MKRSLSICLFAAAILYLPFAFRLVVGGFRPGKIALDEPLNPAWSAAESPLEMEGEIEAVLSRPFSYLSHGGQSFVFASEDGRFIIKLFRQSTRPHPWRKALRRLVNKKGLEPSKKTEKLFSACKLAYEQASDLTGLVYIHLNPTENGLPKTIFKGRLGRIYSIDLNRCSFAIQRKGTPIRLAFAQAVKNNDRKQFLHLAELFATLLKDRTDRKLRNSDTKIGPNFGFLADSAIEWDFGNYYTDERLKDPEFKRKEIQIFSQHLQVHLNRMAPDWAGEAEQIFEEALR